MPQVPPQAAALSAPSRREYAAMLLPFILSTVTQPLIGAVDTAVMGRLSDPSYIAGVAVGAVIFNTLYWLLGFLRVGSTGFSAQALATGDAEAAWKAFLLPGIMALLLGTLILLCRDAVFSGAMFLLRLDPAAREVAGIYYDILIWTAPLTLLNYAILGWLMGQARIRASLLMQIGGNAVNMLLDLLFVSLFGWGVPGVAAASVLACLFATITGLVAMRDSLPAPLPSLIRVGEMLRMARVNGNLFLRTVCLLTQTNIFMITTASFGTLTISANAVILQIMLIFSYVFEGIANTSSVFAGKAAGQGCAAILERTRRLTPALVPGGAAGHDPDLRPGAHAFAAPVHRSAGSPGRCGTVCGLGDMLPGMRGPGPDLLRPVHGQQPDPPGLPLHPAGPRGFWSGLAGFCPFLGQPRPVGRIPDLLCRQVVLPAALLAPAA